MTISKQSIIAFVLGLVLGGILSVATYKVFFHKTGAIECVDLPPVLQ